MDDIMRFKGEAALTWLVIALVAVAAFWYLSQPKLAASTPISGATPGPLASVIPTPSTVTGDSLSGSGEEYEFTTFSVIDGALPVYAFKQEKLPACGDGVCSASETCGGCAADCGCSVGEVCKDNGLCYPKEACGDTACSDKEKSSKSCPVDCGCGDAQVYSYYSSACVAKARISEAQATKVAQAYLAEHDSSSKVLYVEDGFYMDEGIKEVTADCSAATGQFCYRKILIDSSGKIIEVLSTN
ncbi:MAG: hypothetical protein V1708_02705 [Candidatus Micrarchaeota archaeon]